MTADDVALFAEILVARFRTSVERAADESDQATGYYWLPGIAHFQGVERTLFTVLDAFASTADPLEPRDVVNPLERCILQLCAWSHDVGMLKHVADDYAKRGRGYRGARAEGPRDRHDEASAWFLGSELDQIFIALADDLGGGGDRARQQLTDELGRYGTRLEPVLDALARKENQPRLRAEVTNLAHTVNLVANYHRRDEELDACPIRRYVSAQPVRTRLLAALFQLTDATDVDRTRLQQSDIGTYRFLEDVDDGTRLHWMKSLIVSECLLDLESRTIELQVDVPREPAEREWDGRDGKVFQKVDEMIALIASELLADAQSVSPVLLDHGLPPIVAVVPIVNPVPTMSFPEDIQRTIEHLATASSPSTSALIRGALEGLNRLCSNIETGDGVQEGDLASLVEMRLREIEDQLERRCCHEGLRKVKALLRAVSDVFTGDEVEGAERVRSSLRDCLRNELGRVREWTVPFLHRSAIRYVHDTFADQRRRIGENVDQGTGLGSLGDYQHVVLYGYSEQVIKLLTRHFKDGGADLAIHVLECRTKTKYTRSNRLVYHDGQRYAVELRRRLGRDASITVYADAAIGHILLSTKRKGHKTLVLFGSNAILHDGAFLHSMGHLSVAAAARCALFRELTRVAVVTDGMKIAVGTRQDAAEMAEPCEHRQDHEQQRNPGIWLSSNRNVIRELEERRIGLVNYQEDEVPRDLLDFILILDADKKIKLQQSPGDGAQDDETLHEIQSHAFDAGDQLKRQLAQRLAATSLSLCNCAYDDPLAWESQNSAGMTRDDRNWALAGKIVDAKSTLPPPPDIVQDRRLVEVYHGFRRNDVLAAIRDFGELLDNRWRAALDTPNRVAPEQAGPC